MIRSLQAHWRVYLIEAWALGMFMVSACAFVILLEHPYFNVPSMIRSPFVRRALVGLAMGITAIALIYSNWGKKSGAHMNPAVTLANYQLDRIKLTDAAWYIIAQCCGAVLFVFAFKWLAFRFVSDASVNYIVTVPGQSGTIAAFVAEFLMSFTLFSVILAMNNSRWAKYTGYVAGSMVFLFISVEAPISGMSINPARSFGSALPAQIWSDFWLYIIAPVSGMQLAAYFYRKWYFKAKGECGSLKSFMSGKQHSNKVYSVLRWYKKTVSGILFIENSTNHG